MTVEPLLRSRRRGLVIGLGLLGLGAARPSWTAAQAPGRVRPADVPKDPPTPLRIRPLAQDLHHPWAVASLPRGEYLVTERRGQLLRLSVKGDRTVVSGLPMVYGQGQGGLLDVIVSPSFAKDQTLFLSYAEPSARGARTAVYRAELQGSRLANGQRIFAQADDYGGGFHFGSRLAIDRAGYLFVTTGDRYHHRDLAQNLGSHLGKIIRIHSDGRTPVDNPFVNWPGALGNIYSFGHRNLQGLAIHPDSGQLMAHEHGPQGGDELNLVQAGQNFGWPVVTFGQEYGSGAPIGEGVHRSDMTDPLYVWVPSIAPSGLAILGASSQHPWASSMLIGGLRARCLVKLTAQPSAGFGERRYALPGSPRIRDVRIGSSGQVLVLTDEPAGGLFEVLV
ncbi:PQQ-dependent sugar dehydrogenase [Betaproteobacteria bacterium LSUCC0115]|nr:PQQ-dependent sugar dehydrogenase [Burkholderiales bacterium LSUCC0115]